MEQNVTRKNGDRAFGGGQITPVGYRPSPSSSREALLDGDGDQTLRRTIHNLFSAGSMLEELRGIMGELLELTGVQYQILMVIARLQDMSGVTIKDVSIQLRVVPSHVTVEVGKMAKRGFIEKLPNASDGRSVLLALTDKGVNAIEQVTPFTRKVNDSLFEGFSRQDFLTLATLLGQFVSNAETTVATTIYQANIAAREQKSTDFVRQKIKLGDSA